MGDVSMVQLLDDLEAEYDALDAVVDRLAPDGWDRPTPADGWRVRHQVAHLALGEELAALAVADAAAFAAEVARLLQDPEAVAEGTPEEADAADPAALQARWRRARAGTVAVLRSHDASRRIPWITGLVAPRTFATARLMETWAHGHDVVTAVDAAPVVTDRLRHVADLGVRAREFSFHNRGLPVPPAPEVVLSGPDGSHWRWGRREATARVEGDAYEFCLVATRRRHPDDTALRATGPGARRWLEVAQAFAGPPADGPPPQR